MGINKRFAEARAKLSQESGAKPGVLDDILPRINQGIVIPIVSNSFRVEQIFREGGETLWWATPSSWRSSRRAGPAVLTY